MCDAPPTYSPALNHGLTGGPINMDVCDPAYTAPSCLTSRSAEASQFTYSEFCSLPPELSRYAVVGKLSPGRKWGLQCALSCELCFFPELQSCPVCCLLSETVVSYILFSFIVVYWERSSSVQLLHHGWAFSAKPIFTPLL